MNWVEKFSMAIESEIEKKPEDLIEEAEKIYIKFLKKTSQNQIQTFKLQLKKQLN